MITQEERERREFIIAFARGSVYFEGCILPKEIEVLNQKYIDGDLDKEEHSRLCIEHIRREHA